MPLKNTLIAAALTLALLGNARAGVKDWLSDKREKLHGETSQPQEKEVATPKSVDTHGERGQRRHVAQWEGFQNARKCRRIGAIIIAVTLQQAVAATAAHPIARERTVSRLVHAVLLYGKTPESRRPVCRG